MHIVYKADNLFDAHLVKHALENAGIPAFVFGEQLLGGMGELPLFGVLRVGIPDAARPQAEAIIAALDLGQAAADPISDADDMAGLPAWERIMLGIGQGILGIGAFKQRLPRPEEALPGREQPLPLHSNQHFVNSHPLKDRFAGLQQIRFALGCFWGAERKFWTEPGVYSTSVGYAGGITPNPTYEEVCSGLTGHTEVVQVVFDPAVVSLERLLQLFWESHDPTQGMRQGNDTGTQYRSAIHATDEAQYAAALASREAYQAQLDAAGYGPITTEIVYPAPAYYYAEDYHQQYLAKNPNGYCGIGGTGVSCPIGLDVEAPR